MDPRGEGNCIWHINRIHGTPLVTWGSSEVEYINTAPLSQTFLLHQHQPYTSTTWQRLQPFQSTCQYLRNFKSSTAIMSDLGWVHTEGFQPVSTLAHGLQSNASPADTIFATDVKNSATRPKRSSLPTPKSPTWTRPRRALPTLVRDIVALHASTSLTWNRWQSRRHRSA